MLPNQRILFEISLDTDFEFLYTRGNNKIIIKGSTGIASVLLPSFYLFMPYHRGLSFLFTSEQIFVMFFRYFMAMHSVVSRIFFFRLKLRGLGYRIRKMTRFLFRFFFARNHFYYFHLPMGLFVKQKSRTLFVVSSDKAKLNDLFNQLLILRKMDMYEKTNSFIVKNKIFFLKKRK
jgi:hypothetical protein